MRKYKVDDERFAEAVKNSYSCAETLRYLNMNVYGSSHMVATNRIKKLGLDTSHWKGCGHLKGKTHSWSKKKDIDDLLVATENFNTSMSSLKKRIIKENILDYKCASCDLSSWLDKPISLQLDHINGNRKDNRIDNLRFLCPNCHSQTETFCRRKNLLPSRKLEVKTKKCDNCDTLVYRNSKQCKSCRLQSSKSSKKLSSTFTCNDCNCIIDRRSKYCKECIKNHRTDKIDWPDNETLKQMVEDSSYLAVGRELGVSDNAIRKRLKKDT